MPAGLEDAEGFDECGAQKGFVALRCAVLALSRCMNNGFRRVICDLPEPGLMKEIHVTVEDVAAKRRVSKDVVDCFRLQVSQIPGGCENIVNVGFGSPREEGCVLK